MAFCATEGTWNLPIGAEYAGQKFRQHAHILFNANISVQLWLKLIETVITPMVWRPAHGAAGQE